MVFTEFDCILLIMGAVGRKKYCCKYPGCNNWYYNRIPEGYVNKHFYKFPKSEQVRQLWKTACKVEGNVDNLVICQDHFEGSNFVNERRDRLNFNAVLIKFCIIREVVSESNIATKPEISADLGVALLDEEIAPWSCLAGPSTSTTECVCNVENTLSRSQDEVISNVTDHDYCF